MPNVRHSCHILEKLEFSRQIIEKYSDVKTYVLKIRPVEAELFGLTDRADAADGRLP
jgi:hypothetical protein